MWQAVRMDEDLGGVLLKSDGCFQLGGGPSFDQNCNLARFSVGGAEVNKEAGQGNILSVGMGTPVHVRVSASSEYASDAPNADSSKHGGNLTKDSLRRSESGPRSNPRPHHPLHLYDQRVWYSDGFQPQLAIQL